MDFPLVSVPNVSEGRDTETIAAIGAAFASHARLLDVHSDADHNRSVYTLVAEDGDLVESLLAGIAAAAEHIDLRDHEGVHPCIGAADVIPLVPLRLEDMGRAQAAALLVARRVGEEFDLPVFLYGELALGRGPAFFRRGGRGELQRRLAAGELLPDFGPPWLDERAGGVIVGARRPLIAFNVNLLTQDVEVAKAIATAVRETGGGFPGVRALGLALPRAGLTQVSMNVEDHERAPLREIVARIEAEAAARGVEVAGSELVGLLPAGAALPAAAAALRLPPLDRSRVLELRLLEG